MRTLVTVLAAASLAACTTVKPVPSTRPLTSQQIAAMGPTEVVLIENNGGVGSSWLMRSSAATAGASAGLIGVLVSVAIDAAMNYAPSKRATRAANDMAEVMPPATLNDSMVERLRVQVSPAAPTDRVSISQVSTAQRVTEPAAAEDAVEIRTAYTLSEDARAMRVVVSATYQNAALPYASPYRVEGGTLPKTEESGPTYRNVFVYDTPVLPAPVLTDALKEQLEARIMDSARDDQGNLPADGTPAYRAMVAEMTAARDDELTKGEIAILISHEWAKDDGALLRREITNAHDLAARYLVLDLNRTAVPNIEGGSDELLETLADGRTVRRVASGASAGSYVSSPANVVDFVTYGNAINYSTEAMARDRDLRRGAREAARPARAAGQP